MIGFQSHMVGITILELDLRLHVGQKCIDSLCRRWPSVASNFHRKRRLNCNDGRCVDMNRRARHIWKMHVFVDGYIGVSFFAWE